MCIVSLMSRYQMKIKTTISRRISLLVNSPLNQRPTSVMLNKAAFTVQKKWCSVQQNHPEDLTHYTRHDVSLSDAVTLPPQTSFVYTYKHKSTALAFLTFALCGLTALLPIQQTVSHFLDKSRRSVGTLQREDCFLSLCRLSQSCYILTGRPNREPPLLSISKARLAFGQCYCCHKHNRVFMLQDISREFYFESWNK